VQTVLPLGDRSPEPWSGAAVPDSVRAPPCIAAIRSVNGCANSSRKAWLDEDGGRAAQDPLLWPPTDADARVPRGRSLQPAANGAHGASSRVKPWPSSAGDSALTSKSPGDPADLLSTSRRAMEPTKQLRSVAVGTLVDPAPPAQIRTCRIAAYGSYLGYLASKRRLGGGCRILALGIQRSTNGQNRSHVIRSR